MAEFDGNGEVSFKEGFRHGHSLSIAELGDRQDTLKQVGSLTLQLVKGVPKSQRASVLQGTNYVLGVASASYGTEYREDPEHVVWIGDDKFKVSRHEVGNRWTGIEDYNLLDGTHATELVVWDHELTPPLVQKVPMEQAQDVMDASNEIYKTDALLAREWLDRTRQFLLQALSSLTAPELPLPPSLTQEPKK